MEAAAVMPVLIIVMFGIWEVGRLIQIKQVLTNAAREGARTASGAYVNGTPVTVNTVQSAVKNYLTSAGMPTAAVNGATIELINQSPNSWTNPSDAKPLDSFDVKITIPEGTAFESLKLGAFKRLTNVRSMSVTVNWQSASDSLIVVGNDLPF
ncbi:MAG: pilus assembly protein [Planctomycetaceae bacterium]|nr:pilus assembly protein [Planctomycetaceae bacterium]